MDAQQLIRSAGIKQTDIASALGVSDATVTRWVRTGFPSDRLAEVVAITNIPAAQLRPDLAALFRGPAGEAAA